MALITTVLLCAAPAAAAGHAGASRPVDLDLLFIGAHPDDEAFDLAAFGAWGEEFGVRTGVVTVTRGEGGGNAVGPEEGPPLGLLREAEERRAVGHAGIRHVFNLDKVDFYYTVSAPLTREVWDEPDALARVVRVVRKTRPELIVTMDPSPAPGNHGHHQLAARLAVEAFDAAADPLAFAGQIDEEGLRPWRAKRLFRNAAAGRYSDATGPECASAFTPTEPTDETFGVWSGARARSGETWAQIAREAQREYASQGWAGFPDEPADPAAIGCIRFTQIAARVPYDARATSRDAMLQGALVRAPGGLPRGAEFQLEPDRFDVAPGRDVAVTVRARAPRSLGAASVRLTLPPGWRGDPFARLGRLVRGRDATATLRVTAPPGATPGRVRIPATLRAGGRSGTSSVLVRLVPAVQGTLAPLPQVADFRSWAQAHAPQLDGLVNPVASLGSGATRDLQIDLRNFAARAEAGTVALRLPPGFAADAAAKPFAAIAAGGTGSVTFRVTNTDPALETSNEGGDYEFEIVTTAAGAASSERAALNLVPVTTVPQASGAPVLDGVESPGEYGGPTLDLSRVWEGDPPSGPPDASGNAKVAWSGDALYVVVNVRDDVLGTVLPASDAKRHWRTDSVELAIDPRGDSENTSTTFKVGVFPTTQEGGPAAYRDADNHQGPVAQTAPGFAVASRLSSPYTGYTLEMKVPFSVLPAAVRPGQFGLNLFIYDSDTQDKTGQTRLGWSTWGGVQGDPYRWGQASVDGYMPPPGLPVEPRDPVFPREAALSIDSPQSITQAARDGVALAGGPQAADRVRIVGRPRLITGDTLLVRLRTRGAGVAHVYATDAEGRGLGTATVQVAGAGRVDVTVPVSDVDALHAAAVAFVPHSGGTDSVSERVRG